MWVSPSERQVAEILVIRQQDTVLFDGSCEDIIIVRLRHVLGYRENIVPLTTQIPYNREPC